MRYTRHIYAPRLVAACFAIVAACGGGPSDPQFDVNGVQVVVRSDAAFAHSADFPGRLEVTISAALDYWGGDWSQLAGRKIIFEAGPYVTCNGTSNAIGCFDGDIHVTTQDAGQQLRCVEDTVLVHEVGHSIVGDPSHIDARWMDFSGVVDELRRREAPALDGSGGCQLYVSIWKHPPQS